MISLSLMLAKHIKYIAIEAAKDDPKDLTPQQAKEWLQAELDSVKTAEACKKLLVRTQKVQQDYDSEWKRKLPNEYRAGQQLIGLLQKKLQALVALKHGSVPERKEAMKKLRKMGQEIPKIESKPGLGDKFKPMSLKEELKYRKMRVQISKKWPPQMRDHEKKKLQEVQQKIGKPAKLKPMKPMPRLGEEAPKHPSYGDVVKTARFGNCVIVSVERGRKYDTYRLHSLDGKAKGHVVYRVRSGTSLFEKAPFVRKASTRNKQDRMAVLRHLLKSPH